MQLRAASRSLQREPDQVNVRPSYSHVLHACVRHRAAAIQVHIFEVLHTQHAGYAVVTDPPAVQQSQQAQIAAAQGQLLETHITESHAVGDIEGLQGWHALEELHKSYTQSGNATPLALRQLLVKLQGPTFQLPILWHSRRLRHVRSGREVDTQIASKRTQPVRSSLCSL